MLKRPEYAWRGTQDDLRALVAAHPWATLVSSTSHGLLVSHLPVLPDGADELQVVGHLARSDADEHELGRADTVLIVQGAHGYISAGWYVGGPYVPTWNYVVVHLHGRPDVLDAEETWDVLDRTVDHFEAVRAEPFRTADVADYARRLAPHVTGFRLTPAAVDAKAKLSQDKPESDLEGVLRGLTDSNDPHADDVLADAMRRGGIPR